MIVKATWDEMASLIRTPQKKPNPVMPEVEINLIGDYSVQGSTRPYRVTFGQTGDQRLFVACTCQGNLHGMACRHIRAAWPIHVVMADLEIDIEF